ncbi:hypothetical protein GMD78_12345 [Ornithinibacillus sp. L9]|uniref:Uncharacterized protein n=1 Tax=Ornithinibacillus caprae TaxID=2678566 RepID=A0A6N8FIA7_9BACI|nr:hypothetical protein [Ornithinibacillus caprae]MUK89163.1 hypothetical protein [Ornithinibacillus caprae]
MEDLQQTINGFALNIAILVLILLAFSGLVSIILKNISIHREFRRIIMGLVTLLGLYVWYQITFI